MEANIVGRRSRELAGEQLVEKISTEICRTSDRCGHLHTFAVKFPERLHALDPCVAIEVMRLSGRPGAGAADDASA